MRRDIILDTETTGLDANNGDRIVEIGCVEMINLYPTGKTFHVQINPERSVPKGASDVHGLTDAVLADKPKFREIAEDFLAFIGDSTLVIHNASFDIGFLNAELHRLGRPKLTDDRVVDTLMLARRKHPAGPNSLDALCSRYGIDNSKRKYHGALLDSELLAEVYVELLGGKQADLLAGGGATSQKDARAQSGSTRRARKPARTRPAPLVRPDFAADRAAHDAFVAKIGDAAIWTKYAAKPDPSPAD
ncbi:MAG: DNA polymerase III subunit epsilon [Hyphomicrobiaceae bacterium]|nr:DNA polymerase III subunit epsilon [Hyphomicrobiaceae bacterium]